MGCFSSWLCCIFSKRHLNLNPSGLHFSQFLFWFFFPWDICGFLAVPVHLSYVFCLSIPVWSSPGTSSVLCKEIFGSDEFRLMKFALPSPENSGFRTLHCACISGMGRKKESLSSGWIPAGFLRFETSPLSSSNTWLKCPSLNEADGCCFKII